MKNGVSPGLSAAVTVALFSNGPISLPRSTRAVKLIVSVSPGARLSLPASRAVWLVPSKATAFGVKLPTSVAITSIDATPGKVRLKSSVTWTFSAATVPRLSTSRLKSNS